MADKTLKYWGWGYAEDGLSAADTKSLLATFADGFGINPYLLLKVPSSSLVSTAHMGVALLMARFCKVLAISL